MRRTSKEPNKLEKNKIRKEAYEECANILDEQISDIIIVLSTARSLAELLREKAKSL